jgi:hypothetical protein
LVPVYKPTYYFSQTFFCFAKRFLVPFYEAVKFDGTSPFFVGISSANGKWSSSYSFGAVCDAMFEFNAIANCIS